VREIIFLLIFVNLFTGCITSYSIGKDMENIDYYNGISKEEAITIAQDYCVNEKTCYDKCKISTPKVFENEKWHPGQWVVYFWSKEFSTLDHHYEVCIDKKTGEVLKAYWTK
jgi:hypothetical protein